MEIHMDKQSLQKVLARHDRGVPIQELSNNTKLSTDETNRTTTTERS